jgi:hypothetical protein
MDENIKNAMQEEQHRGRKGVLDLQARRERKLLKEGFSRLLREGSRDQFVQAPIALGLNEGSAELRAALEVWSSERG